MVDELWQAFVQVTGAVNALLLGTVLMFSPRLRRTRARRKLALAFLAYGYLLVSFTAVDNGWVPPALWILVIDYLVVLLASALFLDYMSGSLGRGDVSRLFYVPPLLVVVVAAISGGQFDPGWAINFVIVLQIGYSSVTTWMYLRYSRQLVIRPRHLFVLLAGLWTLHAFQIARMLLPDINWVFDLVPLVGAALMITLTALVLIDSRTMRQFSQISQQAAPAQLDPADVELYMNTEQPYLDPQLTLDQLADALGLPRRELSQMLGNSPAGNFYSYVNQYRVQEARRLLESPRERRTSIEAVGLMAGFRARSTFYEAFRRETGMTPAQFREGLIAAK